MQLNVEQKKIIYAKPLGHSLVKGVAGSGKTTVAVNRIPYLMSNYCIDNEDRILMVTFNKALANYIKFLYEKVEEENKLEVMTLFSPQNDRLDVSTIDALMYRYYRDYIKTSKRKYDIVTDHDQRKQNIFRQSIIDISKIYRDVKIIDCKNMNFLKDEIEWIKSCDYTELEEYQNVDRVGRMSSNNQDGPQKLLKNSTVRQAIFELMQLYNKRLREQGLIDFCDMAKIALIQAKKKPNIKYTHIIIDESQDLTKLQLQFIKELYNEKTYSSIMFVADTAQSIYPKAWLIKGRSFASIGFDMKGKSNSLAKNYRTTTQIAEAAYSLISKDLNIVEDDNFVKPSLIDKQGDYPIYRNFQDIKLEYNYLMQEIKEKLALNYDYRDIAIVARNKNQLSDFKKYLDSQGIPNKVLEIKDEMDFKEDTIKLVTMHSIKGLEFKVVIIMGLSSKVIPNQYFMGIEDKDYYESMERRLLYVGMTRATEKLYMTSSGEPSKFLGDIDAKFLRLNNDSKIRRFYPIAIDSYILKEKIIDMYSNEEKVRQWVLNELQEVYKYPKELIDIEYGVNLFSRAGSVDGVVYIYNNKNKVPYIFIETKRSGKGIDECISQLKSYMSVSKECQYGIATDGNEFVILNKEQEPISDIPNFDLSMIPASIESFEYIDLRHGRKHEFLRDSSSIAEIIVDENGEEEEYKSNNLTRLNIYSDIAAGKPILINSEIQDKFYLSYHWINDSINSFILRIKGDSMIEANICDGDYVVIKKQSTAENRDIVAVDIDGNATLKRFIPMGDSIFLMPENRSYEPIQMSADAINIIGIAIGVIKKK